MSDERLELVFNEATRAIEHQSRAVDESRTRAGALLTAGAIVASFLGAQALEDQNPGNWGKAGTAAFILLVVVVYVLFPRGFSFVLGARHIIDTHIDTDDHPNDEDQLRWALALELEDAWDANERTRGRLALALSVGCVALGIEVLAWLIEIGG